MLCCHTFKVFTYPNGVAMSTGKLYPPPPYRKLRGYAFDPSLSLALDTVGINNITYKIDWEQDLKPGPIGEYVEVVDFDPPSNSYYAPVDLNDPYLLAADGLSPSESNPQFHQQMVYAVVMTTIKNFEAALGRKILWSSRMVVDKLLDKNGKPVQQNGKDVTKLNEQFIKRLRIYPHALRDANAYYSPQKKALLFGYFAAMPRTTGDHMKGALVFNCLSHDVVAHETTHAILDGLHKRYTEPTNPDVLAFHEAFADIVALFQHFTFPEVLKQQIAKTRGDLGSQNLLGQLAQEFGKATGNHGSLRDAIGYTDEKGNWQPYKPDGTEYSSQTEPHARGSVLVAAVFEAFINLYKSRVKDLLRIASNGTGELAKGDLHPDLVNRLAQEASKTAGHVLRMCIRALDYCPPVDITFGDFLRAVITADAELVADDSKDYRIAFVDAFRRRGIEVENVEILSVSSLKYPVVQVMGNRNASNIDVLTKFLREFRADIIYKKKREDIFNVTHCYKGGGRLLRENGREENVMGLHERLTNKFEDRFFEGITGMLFDGGWQNFGVESSEAYNVQGPKFEVHTLRLASRVGPDGNMLNQIIITVTQSFHIAYSTDGDNVRFTPVKIYANGRAAKSENAFNARGGCTLIFDLDSLELRYAISKSIVITNAENGRKELNYDYLLRLYKHRIEQRDDSDYAMYFGSAFDNSAFEPFSFLHANH